MDIDFVMLLPLVCEDFENLLRDIDELYLSLHCAEGMKEGVALGAVCPVDWRNSRVRTLIVFVCARLPRMEGAWFVCSCRLDYENSIKVSQRQILHLRTILCSLTKTDTMSRNRIETSRRHVTAKLSALQTTYFSLYTLFPWKEARHDDTCLFCSFEEMHHQLVFQRRR